MIKENVIAKRPPDDGLQWDNQCARCGSSVYWEECWDCNGEGYTHHDCGDDTCCCLHPEDNVACCTCEQDGGWWRCMSGSEWCKSNPIPGRDHIEFGEIEWYALYQPLPSTTDH